MKVSLNWAKKLAKESADDQLVDITTEELVQLATERLGGIEGVTDLAKHYQGVVVAQVVSCERHPNADKLHICKINDGGIVKDVARDENGYVQVVCGAPNVRENIFVAWIPPGATVPASYGEKELFVLEARDLRGETSNGMLASLAELGLSDDHSGILEISLEDIKSAGFNDNNVQGTSFISLYDLDDTIIEIENKMFTHRPDGFGQLGVARELAGIQHKQFTSPEWYMNPAKISTNKSTVINELNVSVDAADLCPRYMAIALENVVVKPSPVWLQSYLKRVGVRPINNVVDITNYLMHETAQPLHAFDFDKVSESGSAKIIVRRPNENENIKLLDGKTIQPHKDAVLICAQDTPIALGGVMGGNNSEIDQNTTRIVLECATFDMYNIRKTSMIHGIFTDAVTRFTKGQPTGQLPVVLSKAVEMLCEFAQAKPVNEVVDAVSPEVKQKLEKPNYIEVTSQFINERLGSSFSNQEIIKLLTNLEFSVHEASGPLSVAPPFWRTDIEIPEDIVEEVGRLYGFNRLPITLPKRSIAPVTPDPLRTLKNEIRVLLSRAGANELQSYSFVHGDLIKKAEQDTETAFALRNALSPDLQYYRLSILPSLLDKVRPNIRAGYEEFTLFEIGKAHNKVLIDEQTNLPDEVNNLEMVYSSAKPHSGAAYYHLLRQVDALLKGLGISYKLVPVEDGEELVLQALRPFDPLRSAYIYNATEAGGMIGMIGELKPSVLKAFKLPEYTAAAIMNLDGPSFEVQNRKSNGSYVPLSKYPSSDQDITLKVPTNLRYAELEGSVHEELKKTEYEYELECKSIYQKEPETKNITFHVRLAHPDRTLTTHEINLLIEKITWTAHQKTGAEQV